jgi:hypothetical protein
MYDHLSDLAKRLGHHMAEQCVDGLRGHFGDELLEAFPDETRETIGLALAELAADHLIVLTPVIGRYLPRIWTTVDLFLACDPAITGHDPLDDSVMLAELLLAQPGLGGHAGRLQEASGWDRRRFNPAFALLVPCVADGRIRKPIQNEYPVLGMILADEDKVEPRRYVERNAR